MISARSWRTAFELLCSRLRPCVLGQLGRVALLGVQNPENDHPVSDQLVEDFMGKTVKQEATELLVVERHQFRMLGPMLHSGGDLIEEFVAQTRPYDLHTSRGLNESRARRQAER